MFNQAQCDLESAIGQTLRASRSYGDTPRGRELAEAALRFVELREPKVIDELERRRLKRISPDRAAA